MTETWDISPGQAGLLPEARARSASRRPRPCPRRSTAWPRSPSPGHRAGTVVTRHDRHHRRRLDRRRLGGARPPRPQRVHPHPVPLPRLRPGLGRAGRHRRGGRLLQAWVRDQDAALQTEIIELPGPDPGPADRQRRHGRADRRLRAHGQAAAARRVAQRARSLRARARGRPPLRPGHRRRRLLDVRRRDGSAGGGRRPRPRPRPHRGERGERQPGPRRRTSRT